MDYKQARDWLKTYKGICNKIEKIENDMRQLKSIRFDKESGGGGTPRTLTDYITEKEELEAEKKKIENTIRSVPDFYQQTVLEYKYLKFMSFEKIAKVMYSSISSVFRLHKDGINAIIEIWKK